MPATAPFPMMTVRQVAEELQVTTRTVYAYIREGHLRTARLPGGDYRVQRPDLDRFVETLYGQRATEMAADAQASAAQATRERVRRMSLFERGRRVASRKRE
jgi:excisionase family DNA binding protein